VDPLTRRALDKLMMDAGDDPVAREHVTGYFKLHPDFVKAARAAPYSPLARNGGRLTIDTPDDLAFVEAVHARMAAKAGEASLADLLLLLEREPDLRAVNAHVKQKPLLPSRGLALIRCDGGGKFGYGHVKRMVALARALRDCEGFGVSFALNGTDDALVPIHSAGFEAQKISAHADLVAMVRTQKPGLVILDGREGPSRSEAEALRRETTLMAAVDDCSDLRLACDFAYYTPVPQALALGWAGARTVPRIGWEWALLGLNPQLTPARARGHRPTLLVTMGGSDPLALTERTARALAPLDSNFRIRFVIGSGMQDARKVAARIAAMKSNYETVEGADDLSTEYAAADMALCAFGVSAYELAAFGVPAIYLGLTDDHARAASALGLAGVGASLGVASQVTDAEIWGAVRALMNDGGRRREMRSLGLAIIDGGGAARIAADLAQALKEENQPVKAAR
jgi:spore coat polysaccharide biosynthesis protein SpsF